MKKEYLIRQKRVDEEVCYCTYVLKKDDLVDSEKVKKLRKK